MFDVDLPELAAIRGLDDAGLVDAMAAGVRLQSAWLARVFAAGAELYHRRLREQQVARREIWAIDGWEEVAAEIAAAQGISRGRAAGQLRIGLALAERLPRFGALFAAGVVDFQVVAAVVHRLLIPTRQRTRAQERANRIRQEHNRNQSRLDARAAQRAAAVRAAAVCNDPPPF